MDKIVRIFNGTHTLHCTGTNEHWSFDIKTQKKDARFRPGERLISLLSGPSNTGDWRAIGAVDEQGIHLFRRYATGHLPSIVDKLWSLGTGGEVRGYEWLLAGSCCECNRKLTVPLSIRTGIGPICAERVGLDDVDPDLRKKAMRLRRLRAQVESVAGEVQGELF